jgi:hypothetical protein
MIKSSVNSLHFCNLGIILNLAKLFSFVSSWAYNRYIIPGLGGDFSFVSGLSAEQLKLTSFHQLDLHRFWR